jgi:hypothetical protein
MYSEFESVVKVSKCYKFREVTFSGPEVVVAPIDGQTELAKLIGTCLQHFVANTPKCTSME